jgi:CheY-like chemotaxis protein
MKGLAMQQHTAPPSGAKRAPCILVVDDDADMRELLRLHLKDAGYEIVAAEDAVEAAHRIVEHQPDLIIADYKMPYMDGQEFVRNIRSDATIPDLPVIFITAMENVAELAGKTFGFPLLSKPLRADELLEAVRSALRRPSGPA